MVFPFIQPRGNPGSLQLHGPELQCLEAQLGTCWQSETVMPGACLPKRYKQWIDGWIYKLKSNLVWIDWFAEVRKRKKRLAGHLREAGARKRRGAAVLQCDKANSPSHGSHDWGCFISAYITHKNGYTSPYIIHISSIFVSPYITMTWGMNYVILGVTTLGCLENLWILLGISDQLFKNVHDTQGY